MSTRKYLYDATKWTLPLSMEGISLSSIINGSPFELGTIFFTSSYTLTFVQPSLLVASYLLVDTESMTLYYMLHINSNKFENLIKCMLSFNVLVESCSFSYKSINLILYQLDLLIELEWDRSLFPFEGLLPILEVCEVLSPTKFFLSLIYVTHNDP